MLSFLGFGKTTSEKHEANPHIAAAGGPAASNPNRNKQREMVRLALSAVLRRHGIPSHWLGCDVFAVSRPGAAEGTLVQINVLKWHDGLVHYAPDFQREFANEIRLFDASQVAGDLAFGWDFAPDCGYPKGKLPGPEYWLEEEDDDTGFAPTQMHHDD